jgi:hypothetical protein
MQRMQTGKKKHQVCTRPPKQAKRTQRYRVLNGQEPSGLLDTGTTSTFIAPNDMKYLQPTDIPSNKSVRMPNGIIEKAGEKMIMNNGLRTPANSADAIP